MTRSPQTTADLQQTLQRAARCFGDGDLATADALCSAVLDTRPRDTNALHILGVVRLRQGDPDGAVPLLEKAHKGDRKNVEIMANLGAAYRAGGQTAKAVRILKAATVGGRPTAAAHFNYANALRDDGRDEFAEDQYRRVLRLDPRHEGATRALADLLADRGARDEALSLYATVMEMSPDDTALLNAIGALQAGAGRHDEAEAAFRRAVLLDPHASGSCANLANALALQFSFEEASEYYDRALAADPDCADTLANRANMLRRAGDLAAAEEGYARALAIDPGHLDARAGAAACLLSRGRFGEGWRHYRHRESTRDATGLAAAEPFPPSLAGARVAIVADQGLGDEVFFLRFAAEIRRRGGHVAYRPEPRLLPILERAGVVDTLVASDAAVTGDYVAAVGDLPFLTGMTDDTPPPPSIRLLPDGNRVVALRDRLAAFGPPPWIGVTWRAGTPNIQRLLSKEAPRERLAAAVRGLPGSVVVVQRGAGRGEVESFARDLGAPVLDLSAANDDLEELLALAAALDDYVAVSNTFVHFRAAVGATSRLLVPAPAEFRWMADGDESPWFPGCRIHRQRPDGDWAPAFADLRRSLTA